MQENSSNENTKPTELPELAIAVPIGLGDLIYLKAMLDTVTHRYSKIKIKFYREIINSYGLDQEYNKFLDDMGRLFFSEPPYVITEEGGIPFHGIVSICTDNSIVPVKPFLSHILCKGDRLRLDEEYIVMVTKVRYLPRDHIDARADEFWHYMKKLSNKYKIVILGERVVESMQDYNGHNNCGAPVIYSIYDSIISHLPTERIVDLSLPRLGKTSPNLKQIQQDCLIMSHAKLIVTLGVGGGFCMATAVGNTVGYRQDSDPIADVVFNQYYSDAVVTKDWGKFISTLKRYIT